MMRCKFGLMSVVSVVSGMALSLFASCCAESPQKSRYSFREVAMGCEMRIELYAPSATQAQSLARAAFDRVHALDDVLSDYRTTSEVGRLSTSVDTLIPIGLDLSDALRRSIQLSQATDGLFDATVGASSRLWRDARKSGSVPSNDAIVRANASVGWDAVTMASQGAGITFLRPGIRLDFGAIGKGIAAQAALKTLRELGANQAMCALAGDIACGDPPPNTEGWTIDVVTGLEDVPHCRIILRNKCVSTSGDESQHLDAGGQRYSHLLDPRTGHAVTRRIAATVISNDGAIADGLATALCVGGPELLARSSDLRNALGEFDARVVEITEPNQRAPSMRVTSGWTALLVPIAASDQVSPPMPAEAGRTAAKAASDSSDRKAPHPK